MQFKLQILTVAVLGFTAFLAAAAPVPANPPLEAEARKRESARLDVFNMLGSCLTWCSRLGTCVSNTLSRASSLYYSIPLAGRS
ncbi:hypothetical protein FB451DRAFT_457317 [Mycena latifolia]|nr:hypothetical protein FB451DRAFT_457317 [Mycena latifolia]